MNDKIKLIKGQIADDMAYIEGLHRTYWNFYRNGNLRSAESVASSMRLATERLADLTAQLKHEMNLAQLAG